MVSGTKNPLKVAAGKAAARARWGDQPRIARLDALNPHVRAAIVALIEADRAAKAAEGGQT